MSEPYVSVNCENILSHAGNADDSRLSLESIFSLIYSLFPVTLEHKEIQRNQIISFFGSFFILIK